MLGVIVKLYHLPAVECTFCYLADKSTKISSESTIANEDLIHEAHRESTNEIFEIYTNEEYEEGFYYENS